MTVTKTLLAVLPLAASVLLPSSALAVSSTAPGSILVMPLVVVDRLNDTSIQITNTSNAIAWARCTYVNAYSSCMGEGATEPTPCETDADCPLGSSCEANTSMTSFDLVLTGQQPTYWVVSSGRALDPQGPVPCQPADFGDPETAVTACYGAGLDPGTIPPMPPYFKGELVCVQVAADGNAISQNSLVGLVGVERFANPSVYKYNAIALRGLETNNADLVLDLDGLEYEPCPLTWSIDRDDPAPRHPVFAVPCSQNLVTGERQNVSVEVVKVNEFEQTYSMSISLTGWEQVSSQLAGPGLSPNLLHERWTSTTPGAGLLLIGGGAEVDNAHSVGVTEASTDSLAVAP